ncbi:MAG: metallophosphoesterase [Ferruginibacter sp.]|nr:metallophosphoesterase [Ferruginibacter sp.]
MINRRSFLRNIGLAGAALQLPGTLVAREHGNADTIEGRVHSGKQGIADVGVTDGFSITRTDYNGSYSLQRNDAAEFIYISVPAGYEIPAEKGIAHFYIPVTAAQLKGRADFELRKLAQDDHKHQFVVWADTQIISEADATQLKSEPVPDLVGLIKSYPTGALFHGIGCGDLVWDHFELFDDYREAIGMTGIPFFNVIGNHDMDLDAMGDDGSAKTFKEQFGPTYYSFNRGAVHYVVLDDVFFIGASKKYIGYISETQLNWLKKDLAFREPGSTVVVSLHIPTNTGAARRLKKEEELGGTVSNRKKLYDILAGFNVHIMSGHTHFNEKWEAGNIMEHNHGTVCGAWWTGPVCSDGTPAGYAVYEVNGRELSWYYKSTGKAKTQQLRLYDSKQANSGADICANVWNWDPKWTIEWFEDGQRKGLMEQRIGLDPLAVQLYSGPALPAKHKWVEPTLADHLFYARPSGNAKQIMVKATDRFGNVFTETLVVGL